MPSVPSTKVCLTMGAADVCCTAPALVIHAPQQNVRKTVQKIRECGLQKTLHAWVPDVALVTPADRVWQLQANTELGTAARLLEAMTEARPDRCQSDCGQPVTGVASFAPT